MSVAQAYAKALFETVTEKNSGPTASQICNLIEAELNRVVELLDQSKDARVALVSPVTTAREKARVVTEIANKMSLNPLVVQFLALMASKGRLGILLEVRKVFSGVRLAAEGAVAGQLVSAEPMSVEDVEGLAKSFSRRLGKRIAFRVSTDPELLAGVKVTVSGVTYDGTLRSQLEKLRDRFVSNVVTS